MSDLPDDAETAVASDEEIREATEVEVAATEAAQVAVESEAPHNTGDPKLPADPEAEALAEAEQLHGDPVVDPVAEQRQEAARSPKAGAINPKDDPSIGTMTYGKGMPHERS